MWRRSFCCTVMKGELPPEVQLDRPMWLAGAGRCQLDDMNHLSLLKVISTVKYEISKPFILKAFVKFPCMKTDHDI